MERSEKTDVNLRTFNTAKVFAESILFPLMFDFKKYQRQANFGSDDLKEALSLSEEVKEIQRFNGLKAMSDTCYDLLDSISSTVNLKNNKFEIEKLGEIKEILTKVRAIFYNNKEAFFVHTHKMSGTIETLDRDYFEQIKKIVEICYVNSEILMTRNKLLFSDAKEDYEEDSEIREAIKREYIEN